MTGRVPEAATQRFHREAPVAPDGYGMTGAAVRFVLCVPRTGDDCRRNHAVWQRIRLV